MNILCFRVVWLGGLPPIQIITPKAVHANSLRLLCTLAIRLGATDSFACKLKVLLTELLSTRTVITKTTHTPVETHRQSTGPNYLGIKLDSVSAGAMHAFLGPK